MNPKQMKNKPQPFKPLNQRVLVKIADAPSMHGAIYVPDEAKKKPNFGIVVSVSDDIGNVAIKIGRTVYYSGYAGVDLTIDDVKYLVLKEEDLIGLT